MTDHRRGWILNCRPGAWLAAAAVVLSVGILSLNRAEAQSDAYANLPAVVGSEVGSDTVLQLGHRTWNLERVPDMALVRLESGRSVQSLRGVAGAKEWPANPGENVTLIQTAGKDARALASEPGVSLTGPVYKVGERTVGVADTLCVKFDDSLALEAQAALLAQYGLVVVKTAAENHGLWKLAVATANGEETVWICQTLGLEPGVEWASPNFFSVYQKLDAVDDQIADELFPQQWHLYTPDPLVTSNRIPAVPEAAINAPGAWNVTTGSNDLIVGVIDDGVDATHPDLEVLPGFDAVDGVGAGGPEGLADGHGTAVAGVIAAKLNGFGVVGVAPNVKILPVRLVTGGVLSDDQIRSAFLFCVDRGASVINNSWGYPSPNDPCVTTDDSAGKRPIGPIVGDGLNYALAVGRGGKGTVILFAAGNDRALIDGDELNGNSQVVTVAASNNLARRSWYSSYGRVVDVCAPSSDFIPANDNNDPLSCAGSIWTGGTLSITTTDPLVVPGYDDDGYTGDFGGTSSACPTAAGVAALVLTVNPNLRSEEVRFVLQRTADKIDWQGGQYDGNGFSLYYGHGRVNAASAVGFAMTMGPSSRFFLEGWAGYASVAGLGDLGSLIAPSRSVSNGNVYGFQALTRDGRTIFVSPDLLNIDDRGIISGVATIMGFDTDGSLVRMGEIPLRGRARAVAKGTTSRKIAVRNLFTLTGNGVIAVGTEESGAQTAAVVMPKPPAFKPAPGPVKIRGIFTLSGKQYYDVYPGDPLEVPGFYTKGTATISRFGTGKILTATDGLIKSHGMFTSTDLKSANRTGSTWKGNGILTTGFGRFEGGSMTVSVRSAGSRLGTLRASARNGRLSARSIGSHNVSFGVLTDITPVENAFDPSQIVFTSPGGVFSIRD